MVNVQQVCMFLKSTTGEHEQNGTGLFPGTRSRKEDISRSGMYPIPLQFGEIRKKRFR